MVFRQYIKIPAASLTNDIIYDDGLKSTPTEKKRLLSISVVLSGYADNQLQGYHEKAKVFDIPDRLIDVETDAFTYAYPKPGARLNEIEVGIELATGEVFKLALKVGATGKDVYGTYNYELFA